jgi:type I restriction enzyme R subunit
LREPTLLAKWILENNPNAHAAIITDRDELDKQIERVFTEVGEPIKRTNRDLNYTSLFERSRVYPEDADVV